MLAQISSFASSHILSILSLQHIPQRLFRLGTLDYPFRLALVSNGQSIPMTARQTCFLGSTEILRSEDSVQNDIDVASSEIAAKGGLVVNFALLALVICLTNPARASAKTAIARLPTVQAVGWDSQLNSSPRPLGVGRVGGVENKQVICERLLSPSTLDGHQISTRNPSSLQSPNHGGIAANSRPVILSTGSSDEPYGRSVDACKACAPCGGTRRWIWLPDGLLYEPYLAGEKEPRMRVTMIHGDETGTAIETSIGGRFGLVRNGTPGPFRPQGNQLDLEAAVQSRLNADGHTLIALDYRFGIVRTCRRGPSAIKYGYYHVSAHMGDEFLLMQSVFPRVNYTRDSVLFGTTWNLTPDTMVYGEVAYSFLRGFGARPWELQYGIQYSPACPGGSPFVGINAHLRQDFDFDGVLNVMAGWQWRGAQSNRVFRLGVQYFDGPSLQYSFFNAQEQFIGVGISYDY